MKTHRSNLNLYKGYVSIPSCLRNTFLIQNVYQLVEHQVANEVNNYMSNVLYDYETDFKSI